MWGGRSELPAWERRSARRGRGGCRAGSGPPAAPTPLTPGDGVTGGSASRRYRLQQGLPGPLPQRWGDPEVGYPDEGGGGEGHTAGLPRALRARPLPATRGIKRGFSQTRGSPDRGGEGSPLPAPKHPSPESQPRLAAAKSLATRSGHRGLRGHPRLCGLRGGAGTGGSARTGAGGVGG